MVLNKSERTRQNCLNKSEISQAKIDESYGNSVVSQALHPSLDGISPTLTGDGQEDNRQKRAYLRGLIAHYFNKQPLNAQIAYFNPTSSAPGINELNIQPNTASSMFAFFNQLISPQPMRMRMNLCLPTLKT